MSGFRKFLMRGNLIDMAVAVVVGVAFNDVVQALVKDLVTPLVTVIAGNPTNFAALHVKIGGSKFLYGTVINTAISFLIVSAVVYYLLVAPSNRLIALATRNKAATDRQCPECLSQIPIGAKRCMYCTSEVPPAPQPDVPAPRRARRRHLAAD